MLIPILLAAAGLSGPPPALVRYEVEESVRALTPAGPRDRAIAGTVSTMGGKARWDLKASHFPGVAARTVLSDGGALVLLDSESSTATPLSAADFEQLFRPPSGPSGASSADIRDLSVTVERDGSGARFQGAATLRWAVRCSWNIVSVQPGRLVRVKHEVKGSIDAVEDFAPAPTPFDDLLRLFSARGEAREALEVQLGKVAGLPVRVRLEALSEVLAEPVGPGSAAAAGPPARATATTTRTVTNLRRSPATAEDAALFAIPESYRSVPFERLKGGGPPLP